MPKQENQKTNLIAVIIVAVLVVAAIIIWAISPRSQQQLTEDTPTTTTIESGVIEVNAAESKDIKAAIEQRRAEKAPPMSDIRAGANLDEITQAAQSWSPSLQQVYGQNAPDFTLTDIYDKQHRLSDYKGSNVLIVYWATWCPYCRREIPHLNLMQKRVPESRLKILAITNENKSVVRDFADSHNMLYTALIGNNSLPRLYQIVPAAGIPSAIFIDPEGKIKFITVGYMPLDDILAVIGAEK
jgi:peroxiredoxin